MDAPRVRLPNSHNKAPLIYESFAMLRALTPVSPPDDRLIELAAERLQGGDPSLFWSNVANLMYAGAAGHEAALQEKVRQAAQALQSIRICATTNIALCLVSMDDPATPGDC